MDKISNKIARKVPHTGASNIHSLADNLASDSSSASQNAVAYERTPRSRRASSPTPEQRLALPLGGATIPSTYNPIMPRVVGPIVQAAEDYVAGAFESVRIPVVHLTVGLAVAVPAAPLVGLLAAVLAIVDYFRGKAHHKQDVLRELDRLSDEVTAKLARPVALDEIRESIARLERHDQEIRAKAGAEGERKYFEIMGRMRVAEAELAKPTNDANSVVVAMYANKDSMTTKELASSLKVLVEAINHSVPQSLAFRTYRDCAESLQDVLDQRQACQNKAAGTAEERTL